MPYTYQYPRPALTVDCVIFTLAEGELKVLLVQRARDPFAGYWALPGGFVDVGETPQQAAQRELAEETGLGGVRLEQLYTFGEPDRDPRGHVVSVAHCGLVRAGGKGLRAADDARNVGWFPLSRPPALAFDHQKILAVGHQWLCEKIRCQPAAFELLPHRFTLRQLRQLYEVVLGRKLDGRSFRRRVLRTGLVVQTNQTAKEAGRPVPLYRFDRNKYRRLSRQGFRFAL